jgi:hypothetical protein
MQVLGHRKIAYETRFVIRLKNARFRLKQVYALSAHAVLLVNSVFFITFFPLLFSMGSVEIDKGG